MPLDFNKPVGERTLGRRRAIPEPEREKFPRYALQVGLRLNGGYDAPREPMESERIRRYVAELEYEERKQQQTVRKPGFPVDGVAGWTHPSTEELAEVAELLRHGRSGVLVDRTPTIEVRPVREKMVNEIILAARVESEEVGGTLLHWKSAITFEELQRYSGSIHDVLRSVISHGINEMAKSRLKKTARQGIPQW